MTAVLEAAVPEAGRRRPRLRVGLVAAVAAVGVAVATVALLGGFSTAGKPRPAPPGAVSGVAGWFAAASGPTCRSQAAVAGLPDIPGAISCRPVSGISAAFARLGSAHEAARYLDAQTKSHAGALLTAWTAGRAPERGRAVFFSAGNRSTVMWSYQDQPFVGWATSTGKRSDLLGWWTALGRSAVPAG